MNKLLSIVAFAVLFAILRPVVGFGFDLIFRRGGETNRKDKQRVQNAVDEGQL